MKKLCIVILLIVFIVSCLKSDLRFDIIKHGAVECKVQWSEGIPYDGLSFGNGFSKIINEQGLVTYFETAIASNFDHVDSAWYNIRYRLGDGGIIADIAVSKTSFQVESDANGELTILHPTGSYEDYTLTAWFDIVSGHLTRIAAKESESYQGVDFKLTYGKKGRLMKFGRFELSYDAKGNVTRVPKRDPALNGMGGVIYTYDLGRSAKGQMYLTSGYNVHEFYNLAEACQWIPVSPHNLRILQQDSWQSWGTTEDGDDYIAGSREFFQHTVDQSGYLINYKAGYRNLIEHTVHNVWDCRVYGKKDFKRFKN